MYSCSMNLVLFCSYSVSLNIQTSVPILPSSVKLWLQCKCASYLNAQLLYYFQALSQNSFIDKVIGLGLKFWINLSFLQFKDIYITLLYLFWKHNMLTMIRSYKSTLKSLNFFKNLNYLKHSIIMKEIVFDLDIFSCKLFILGLSNSYTFKVINYFKS